MNTLRRTALLGMASTAAAISLNGCRFGLRSAAKSCPGDPRWSDSSTPLTIDAHCHLFNGTDLPIKDFVVRVAAAQRGSTLRVLAELFGPILQGVVWTSAPSAEEEVAWLRANVLPQCQTQNLLGATEVARADRYSRAVKELKASARAYVPRSAPESEFGGTLREFSAAPPISASQTGANLILALPDRYSDRVTERDSLTPFRKTFDSVVDFVLEMFQYRYVSLQRYLESYSAGPDRRVDLLGAAIVDYDWWLAGKSLATRTPLPQQIGVMDALAAASGGRVHAYAPFCPLRDAIYRQYPTSTFSSLGFVRTAVRERGAIGVKLYPPMGFAPFGNSELQRQHPTFWRRATWLPSIAAQANFGHLLDEALADLYKWCIAEDVPIIAHASASNGAFPEFEDLARASHWNVALTAFPGLRVNFAHFGGGGMDGRDLLAQLTRESSTPGINAYVDASYFTELLDDPTRLTSVLRNLVELDAQHEKLLLTRTLYGSDWKMLILEQDASKYLTDFGVALSEIVNGVLPQDAFRSNFFGLNAVSFLGLKKGQATRRRLDDYYAARGLSLTPTWMSKVDAVS